MSVQLLNQQIDGVAIVDDEPQSRTSYGYTIENADLTPISENGPLGTLDQYLQNGAVEARAQAGLCDFQLSARAYAAFSGAQLVSNWYRRGFPALLCTRFEKAQIERIRPYRRWIPVLIKPAELTEDTLVMGLEECIHELQVGFRPTRRPWRVQVHFLLKDEDINDGFFVEIPGWEPNEVIRIHLSDLPDDIQPLVREDYRCHAQANLAAEYPEDLYLCDWERE